MEETKSENLVYREPSASESDRESEKRRERERECVCVVCVVCVVRTYLMAVSVVWQRFQKQVRLVPAGDARLAGVRVCPARGTMYAMPLYPCRGYILCRHKKSFLLF
jgi:hypothetical protein